MSGFGTRAVRALRQRGLEQFCRDGAILAAETVLSPRLGPIFESRALREEDLFDICATSGTFFEYYDDRESYTLNLPTTPHGYSGKVQEEMRETYASGMTINAPFVCELYNVDLVGPEAVAVSDDGYVFENALESSKRLTTGCLRAIAEGKLPVYSRRIDPSRSLDAVVSLVGPWTNNYTHWFQDYLTRLEGLEWYRSRTDVDPKLLIPATASTWMLDALRATGYGPDQWVEWEGSRVRADRLIVPSVRREKRSRAPNRRIVYSPTGICWVRDRILDGVEPTTTSPHSDRIYISRSNALARRVVNEDDVMALLSDWGFDCYCPEELSFAEQVTLFSNADAIVSPHGSGLMNQIFADDAAVIELMGKKQTITSPATEYYYAELLGHDYACVPGEAVGADLRTDVSGLEIVLKKILEGQ
jgi:hypothetical protein